MRGRARGCGQSQRPTGWVKKDAGILARCEGLWSFRSAGIDLPSSILCQARRLPGEEAQAPS